MRSGQKWYFRRRTIVIEFALALIIIFLVLAVSRFSLNRNDEPLPKYYVPDAMIRDFENAKRRWAARTFSSYRMTVVSNDCEEQVEVHNEMIVRSSTYFCSSLTMTVSDLFGGLDHDMTTIQWTDNVGCSLEVVHPTYNSSLGYPEKIEYSDDWADHSNLKDQYYSRYVAPRTGPCGLMAFVKPIIRIQSFTPLYQETF